MYEHDDDGYNPPLGEMVGELSNELKDTERIVEFAAIAAKSYGYKAECGETGAVRYVVKNKGFTARERAGDLNFDAVRRMATEYLECGRAEPVQVRRETIKQIPGRYLRNSVQEKKCNVVLDKRVVMPDGFCVPYGFK